MFNERCDQENEIEIYKPKAFPIMLCGRALQFYFDTHQGKLMDFDWLTNAIKKIFVTAEHTRTLLREYDSLAFRAFMKAKNDMSNQNGLEKLVSLLQDIQSSLSKEYRSEEILSNKLLNSVKDVESCRLA